ncbi:hypothetical protein TNCV_4568131 [Trichonephila clavipes]|nr:hypothetical protein TNCV_4568131 [Trichonephila clavipes]
MATGSYLNPIYSRSQSEVQGDLHKLNEVKWKKTTDLLPFEKGFIVGARSAGTSDFEDISKVFNNRQI